PSTQLPNSTAAKIARTRAAAAKLVRLLASDLDGEVLGAVRALKSTLRAAELDLHDRANIVEFSPHRGMLAASPREMIKCCRTCPELLTSKELAFVHSMARWHGTPTQRQLLGCALCTGAAWQRSARHERPAPAFSNSPRARPPIR